MPGTWTRCTRRPDWRGGAGDTGAPGFGAFQVPKIFSICSSMASRCKIADDDQQRIRRELMHAGRTRQLIAGVRGDLLFGGRDDGIRMLAEEDAAQAFAGEKAGRGALDSQLFESLAALALEFVLGKRCVAREIGHQFEHAGGKFREARNGNGAGIGAGVRAKTGAHAAQILFNAAAGARRGSGANDGGRHFGEAGRANARRRALPLRK